MIRINLASRPFYNERAVQLGLWISWLISLVIFAIGGLHLQKLETEYSVLTRAAEREERSTTEINQESMRLKQQSDLMEVDFLGKATSEANHLINERQFSWTEFLNLIETTLPVDVRLTTLQPDVGNNDATVSIGAVGRNVITILDFIERLESTGEFVDVLPVQEAITDSGMHETTLVGRYIQNSDKQQALIVKELETTEGSE